MLNFTVIATAFVVILPVELPDKTFIATLILSTRFRPLYVWIGVAAAFAVHTLIAVAFGSVLTLLPRMLILLAAAALFAVGAVLLWRQSRAGDDPESEEQEELDAKLARYGDVRGVKVIGVSFLVLMLAEWGDLSQLFTAGLAARSGEPLSVFIGAWSALALVSGLAAALGKTLLSRLPVHWIQRVAAAICLVLAVLTLVEALSG